MHVAATKGRAGERDVDRLGLGEVCHACGVKLRTASGQPGLDFALGFVRGFAEGALLFRGKPADVGQQAADMAALAAEVLGFDALEVGGRLRLADRGQRLARQRRRVAHTVSLRRISNRINAAAAATLRDSTPSVSGTVTSLRSFRESPCASLPSTIIPADSIGASTSGAPPAEAAPKPSSSSRSFQCTFATFRRNTFPAEARTAFGPYGSALPGSTASAVAPAAAAVRQIAPTLPGS